MDDRRLDLGALDPGRDPERFERMVRSVLARAGAPPEHPFALALVARGRVAVLAAVAIAAAAWIHQPVIVHWKSSPSVASDPVATVVAWAEAGEIPAGVDLYRTLGVNDER